MADGREAINSVILSDAMYLSAFTGQSVTLPFDDSLYVKELEKRVAASKKRQPAANPLALVESTFEITDQKIMDRYFGISRDN